MIAAEPITYIINVDGLRIAHFGDTEQLNLTESQRRSLKNIDVAFSEFWDEPKNRFYNIMDELGPRLIIPTHVGSLRALEKATEKWPSFKRMQKEVTLTREKLPERTTFLLLGDWVKVYESSLKIPEWEEN